MYKKGVPAPPDTRIGRLRWYGYPVDRVERLGVIRRARERDGSAIPFLAAQQSLER